MRLFVKVWLCLLIFQSHAMAAPVDNSIEPLVVASENGDISIMKTLISKGENVNQTSIDGRTALIVATFNGRDEAVSLLIENGANVNAKLDNGLTALMIASLGKTEITLVIMKKLIAAGSDPNSQDSEGRTALMAAVIVNDIYKVNLLIKSGADRFIKDKKGLTSLDYAMIANDKIILKALQASETN